MLYVADLGHDGLLKVGITTERRERARVSELRRKFGEPDLEIFLTEFVPYGWGTDESWERRLLANILRRSNRMQLFARQHKSTEVIEATREEASAELRLMLRETEVNPELSASQLDLSREDWRFYYFLSHRFPEIEYSSCRWGDDPITRQLFLYSLRDEPLARWERLSLGYSCSEIDNI